MRPVWFFNLFIFKWNECPLKMDGVRNLWTVIISRQVEVTSTRVNLFLLSNTRSTITGTVWGDRGQMKNLPQYGTERNAVQPCLKVPPSYLVILHVDLIAYDGSSLKVPMQSQRLSLDKPEGRLTVGAVCLTQDITAFYNNVWPVLFNKHYDPQSD